MKKRMLSLLLALAMTMAILPMSALAGDTTQPTLACLCAEPCTEEARNTECPLCGAEPFAPENCAACKTAQEKPEQDMPAETPTPPPEPDAEEPAASPEPTAEPTATPEPTTASEIRSEVVQKVQERIDALPDAEGVIEGDLEDLYRQLEAIDEAMQQLTEKEQKSLNLTRYDALGETLQQITENCAVTQAQEVLYLGGTDVLAHPNGNGYSYDATTSTLTLNGYSCGASNTYKVPGSTNNYQAYLYSSVLNLTIRVVGNNTMGAESETGKYIRDNKDAKSAGIYGGGLVTIVGGGTLTIYANGLAVFAPILEVKEKTTVNAYAHRDAVQVSQLTMRDGATLRAEARGNELDYVALHVRSGGSGNGTAKIYDSTLEAETYGYMYGSSYPYAIKTAGQFLISGSTVKAYSSNNRKDDVAHEGCAIYTPDLQVLNSQSDVTKGSELTAEVRYVDSGKKEGREAIYVSGTMAVDTGCLVNAKTNASVYKCGAVRVGNLQTATENNNTAVIIWPSLSSVSNGYIYDMEIMAKRVTIAGLRRLRIYMRESETYKRMWSLGIPGQTGSMTQPLYSEDGLNLKGDGTTILKSADYTLLEGVTVESGTHTLILDSIVRTGCTEPYIRVKSGATLNLKLTGASLLAGNGKSPVIRVEDGATLNLIGNGGTLYPSLSVQNTSGNAIGGGGTVTVADSVLYCRGGSRADIAANLQVQNGGYANGNITGGSLTMDGGSYTGEYKVSDTPVQYKSGSLNLTNTTLPTVKNGSETLYRVRAVLAQAELQTKDTVKTAALYTTVKSTPDARINFIFATRADRSSRYGAGTSMSFKAPLAGFTDNSDTHMMLTLYLPLNAKVLQATAENVMFWAASAADSQAVAKADNSGMGILSTSGNLLMSGTMALRTIYNVNLTTGAMGNVTQAATGYDPNKANYWQEYTKIELSSPNGTWTQDFRLLVQSGTHRIALNGLKLEAAPCAAIRAGDIVSETGNLVLEQKPGTENHLAGKGDSEVFTLAGGLTLRGASGSTLEFSGHKLLAGTSPDTSTLSIADNVVINNCTDKNTTVELKSLYVKNSTVMGLGMISCSDIRIDGGSVDFNVPKGTVVKNTAGTELEKQEITLPGAAEKTKITGMDITGLGKNSFDSSNILADKNGKLHLWLPKGAIVNSVTAGQNTYYQVTLNPDNGEAVIKQMVLQNGTAAAPKEPAKAGYDFAGWTLNGKLYDFTQPVTAPLTLTAGWRIKAYTITYVPGTYGIGNSIVETKTYNVPLTLQDAIFTRKGFTQTGWATQQDGPQVYAAGASYTDNAAQTLYPVWQAKGGYTVHFDTNGGTAVDDRINLLWTDPVISRLASPTRQGFDFLGWKLEERTITLGDTYGDLAAEDTDRELTLTAAWQDVAPPTGTVTVAQNSWNRFWNQVTFGLFFKKTQTVTITAEDNSGETVTVEYLLSVKELTMQELDTAVFTPYTDPFAIEPDNEYIIYAKLTDTAGLSCYINSDGLVLDATAPLILGIEDGKTYCTAQTFTVTEKYTDTVKVNGQTVTPENGSYVLQPQKGTQTVLVRDKAGNTAEMTVTVNNGHTYSWQSENGRYWQKCCYCGQETDKADIPQIAFAGADTVCRIQSCTLTFTVADSCTDVQAFYTQSTAARAAGIPLILEQKDGQYIVTIPAVAYAPDADALTVTVTAKTVDGFDFSASRIVQIDSRHTGGTATCTKRAVCHRCGAEYGTVDADNHTDTWQWVQTETAHRRQYKCCGAYAGETQLHTWKNGICQTCGYVCMHTGGTATCQAKAVCAWCGMAYGEPNYNNHTGMKHVPVQAPTEKRAGHIEYWTCTDCGRIFSDALASKLITKQETVLLRLGVSPATGDEGVPLLWLALFVAGGAALTGLAITKKRKK